MQQVRLILVGGFLGAGKTTLLGQAARRLTAQGKRVGLITNDQAPELVDTALLKQAGFGVGEVAGGCFCCRFDDLVHAADKLMNELRPDVLLGEPVGSCTDLSATVLQPMKALYADWFRVAPFSVLAEPARMAEALRPDGPTSFPDEVLYIFRKQLEEADMIVLNKTDLLSAAEREELRRLLRGHFPRTPVQEMSAASGDGVAEWLAFVLGEERAGERIATVNYDVYARGEAALGWLNASVQLRAQPAADWRQVALGLIETMQQRLNARRAEVAHVKLMLAGAGGALAVNLTRSAGAPEVHGEAGAGDEALLLVNARVHLPPEELRAEFEASLAALPPTVSAEVRTIECFRPARPQPTHRFRSPV